jgi:hypothetical protein
MKHRMFMVVVALAATLALAAPVGAASSHSQGAANASPMAWHNWVSFDGGMAPGLVPAQDPTADESTGDDTNVDEDGDGDTGADEDADGDGSGAEDDQGDDQAEDGTDDTGTDESTDPTAGRPQNHGWYVSQVAKDKTLHGRDHGKAVSTEAHSQDGKDASGGDSGDTGDEGGD